MSMRMNVSRHLTKTTVCGLLLLNAPVFAETIKADNPQNITDSKKTILVDQINPQFTITLPSTPSTGYSWLLESYNPNFVTLVKHEYTASTKSMAGASGVENWTFEVQLKEIAGPQLTKINFINARMWDINNTTVKKETFTIALY